MASFSKKIYFGVSQSKGSSWFFKIISLVMKTAYSHSFMVYYDKDIKEFVVTHADKICVHTMLIKDFLKDRNIFKMWSVGVDEDQRIKFLKNMHKLDGETYSFLQILGIACAMIFKKDKNPLRNYDLGNDEDFICSEYFDTQLEQIDIEPSYKILKKGSDLITPKDNVKCMEYHEKNNERVKNEDISKFIEEVNK